MKHFNKDIHSTTSILSCGNDRNFTLGDTDADIHLYVQKFLFKRGVKAAATGLERIMECLKVLRKLVDLSAREVNNVFYKSGGARVFEMKGTVEAVGEIPEDASLAPLLCKCSRIIDAFWTVQRIGDNHFADLQVLEESLYDEMNNTSDIVQKRFSCWVRELKELELHSFHTLRHHMIYGSTFMQWVKNGGDFRALGANETPNLAFNGFLWNDEVLNAQQRFFCVVIMMLQKYWGRI